MSVAATFAQARSNAPPASASAARAATQAHNSSSSGAMQNVATPAVRLSAGGGQPLPGSVRLPIERSLGENLSHVRVHQDKTTATAVDSMGARAFAYGSGIYLGSRESANDLRLMAHESAHVIQQRGGASPLAKRHGGGSGMLEAEADRAASAVGRGERMAVTGRTGLRPQFAWDWNPISAVKKAASAVVSGVKSVASAVADSIGAVVQKAVNYLRERAQSIPGYDLLAFAMGRDPLTQAPVTRNATTLLKALLGLIPGGAQIFENLEKSKVLERAFQWASSELEKLGLTWARVRGAVEKFISSLQLSDAFNLGGVFERAKAIFGGIVGSAISFAKAAGSKLMEFVFEGAMALAGPAGQRILGVFRKIGDTFTLIVNDPIGFLRNLVNAVKGGFEQFRDNFGEHLKNAIFGWLFGALQGTGIKLPEKFDFKGIVSIILQVLGLTYDNLRARMVKLVGESVVSAIETGLDFVVTLIRDGVAAAWEKIMEFAGNLKDMLIGAIKDFMIKTIVGKAIIQIASMLNPVGALIQACIKIYDTVMFVIERAKQIMEFVEAVVDSLANIARGNIAAAKNYVEKTLARILPLVISFLARLVGLGGISDHIRKAIEKIQAPINKALDKITEWIKEKAKGLVGKAKDVLMWWKKKIAFKTKTGESHSIQTEGEPPSVRIAVHSEKIFLEESIKLIKDAKKKSEATILLGNIVECMKKLETLRSKKGKSDAENTQVGSLNTSLDKALREMSDILSQAGVLENTSKKNGDGSRSNPYKITWQKPPLASYIPFWLAPQGMVKGRRTSQKEIQKLVNNDDKYKYSPTDVKKDPGGNVTIGIASMYQTRLGLVVGPQISVSSSRKGVKEFNKLLEKHGYDRKGDGETDGDHVVELQVSGVDATPNLWPLNSRQNRDGGRWLYNLEVDIGGGSKKRVKDLGGKYFKIVDFKY